MKKNIFGVGAAILLLAIGAIILLRPSTESNVPKGLPKNAKPIPMDNLYKDGTAPPDGKELAKAVKGCKEELEVVAGGSHSKDKLGNNSLTKSSIAGPKGPIIVYTFKQAADTEFCATIWNTRNKFGWSNKLLKGGGVIYDESNKLESLEVFVK